MAERKQVSMVYMNWTTTRPDCTAVMGGESDRTAVGS